MAIFSTDDYARGQQNARSAPPGAAIAIPFDTNNAPGANVGAATVVSTGPPIDEIRLLWLPPNPVICGYHINISDMDNAAALILSLRDGAGNIYNAGLTTGQAGGTVTPATAAANRIGVIFTLTDAQRYMTLVCTTSAAGASGVAGRVSGVFIVQSL